MRQFLLGAANPSRHGEARTSRRRPRAHPADNCRRPPAAARAPRRAPSSAGTDRDRSRRRIGAGATRSCRSPPRWLRATPRASRCPRNRSITRPGQAARLASCASSESLCTIRIMPSGPVTSRIGAPVHVSAPSVLSVSFSSSRSSCPARSRAKMPPDDRVVDIRAERHAGREPLAARPGQRG